MNALSKIADDYRRSAINRFDEAVLLQRSGKNTGAIYLAGYAVECMLKVMVLSTVSCVDQEEFAKKTFRGSNGHDFECLRSIYVTRHGAGFPAEIGKLFTLVSDWSTDLRYDPEAKDDGEAELFLAAVKDFIEWAKGKV